MNEVIIILIIGLAAGLLNGSMGVGGGIIIVPALVFIMGFSMRQAQGTSLMLMTMPVMIVAAINYYKEGYINFKVALLMAVTFVVGSYFGSVLAMHIPAKFMKKAFGVLMIIAAIKMITSK